VIVEQFSVEAPSAEGEMIVRAFGEIDLVCRDAFVGALRRAADAARAIVGVDMSGVLFMDSSGVGALLDGRNYANERERALRVLNPSPPVRRVLDTLGLLAALGVEG
jgi:anti-anti-sigma factor